MNRRVHWAVVGGIFFLALAIRLVGISWGLPGKIDINPDENAYVISNVSKILQNIADILHHKAPFSLSALDPGFLNYPAFLMYLTGIVYMAGIKIGLLAPAVGDLYLAGRMVSAFFGAATAIVVVNIVSELGGGRVSSFISGLFMALCPQHVWDSHVAVTDVLMTFWISLTIFASLRLMRSGRYKDYIVAGVCLGLAIGSKYTAAFTVVAVIAASFISFLPFVDTLKRLFVAAFSTVISFFLVAPFSLIRFSDLVKAMAYENKHTHGFHYGFSFPAPGWQYHKYIYQLFAAWPFSLGFALYAACVIGFFVSFFRPNKGLIVLLSFFMFFFLITGSWSLTPLRYYLPVLMVLIILSGFTFGKWIEQETNTTVRWGSVFFVGMVTCYTVLFTWQTTVRFKNDTRIQATDWLHRYASQHPEIKKFVTVGAVNYSASFVPGDFTDVQYLSERDYGRNYKEIQADLLQLTSLQYSRAYRHNIVAMMNLYNTVRFSDTNYYLVKKFDSSFINKDLYMKLDPMFGGYFISPTLEFYRPL